MAYVGILDYYGIRAVEVALPKKQNYKQAHRLSKHDMARNLANWPEPFNEVKEYIAHAGILDQIEYINGQDDIRYRGQPMQVTTIKNQLIKAISMWPALFSIYL